MTRKDEIDARLTQPFDDACVEWLYAKTTNGYGMFGINGGVVGVHRYVCEQAHGPAPEKHDAAHSCGNKLCYNPNHLRWATRAENNRDKRKHGRSRRPKPASWGELHHKAVLTEEKVREIIASSETTAALARKFGVSESAVRSARKGITWSHVLLEADVDKAAVKFAEENGVPSIRMHFGKGVSTGWPDRMFLIPGGRPLLMEMKAPNKEPTVLQEERIEALETLSYDVAVCDMPYKAIAVLSAAIESARRVER